MKIATKAPGKLVLLGEYAVLEGGVAISMAVDRWAEVRVVQGSGQASRLLAPAIGIDSLEFEWTDCQPVFSTAGLSPDRVKRLALVKLALEDYAARFARAPQHLSSLELEIDTSSFQSRAAQAKLGLGSSAAAAVAVVAGLRALGDATGHAAPVSESIVTTAQRLHHQAQGGLGSGIDIATSFHGGVVCFQPGSEGPTDARTESLTWPKALELVPIYTGQAASTPKLVTQVQELKAADGASYDGIIGRMHEVANAGVRAFGAADVHGFCDATDAYGDLMAELGHASGADIVCQRHEALGGLVRRSGAAYKPSGAGGGDLGIAVCSSVEQRERVLETIETSGFVAQDFGFCPTGLAPALPSP